MPFGVEHVDCIVDDLLDEQLEWIVNLLLHP
jgi:hypothetical protein